jgi:two-component system, NarL family, response regulator DegU
MSKQPLTVFIADRYDHFREDLKKILSRKSIEVIVETDTAEDILDLLETKHPNLVITAHRLNDESADYFLPIIKERFPEIKILLLTLNCNKKTLLKYVQYLDGMLCKMAHKDELLDAIMEIVNHDKLYFRINKYESELKDQRQNRLR